MKKKMVSILTAAFCASALLAGAALQTQQKHLPHQQEQHPPSADGTTTFTVGFDAEYRRTATWTMRRAITPDLTWSSAEAVCEIYGWKLVKTPDQLGCRKIPS